MSADLREHASFGRTGLTVSRLGLASGFGLPTASIEKAFHEYGVNYFYLSFIKRGNMARAVHNLAPKHRNELRIVLAWPASMDFRLQPYVDKWLKTLRIDRADMLVLQDLRKPPSPKLAERVQKIRESGKVRFIGMSGHNRPLFGQIARGEVENAPADFFQVRYNAVHPGAEQDIFPHLPVENRPGIVVYTATCWRKLLNPKLMPPGETPLAPADCYRFVLSNPDVNVCVTGPSTAEQMEENLSALAAGPLNEEEMARVRRIGQHIHNQKSSPPLLAR